MGSVSNLKIAVLINTPPDETNFQSVVQECFREAFASIAPTGEVDFYDPVVERKFPDASRYDLVVLSGGKIDAACSDPWVLGVLDYVRITTRDVPKTKILAVCWGHQAVSRAFGGQVRPVPAGEITAIEDIRLTDAGKKFFPFAAASGSYRAIELHSGEVYTPPAGFISLAENQECFISDTNNVLTFQAHPEISHELARKLILEEDKKHSRNSSAEELGVDRPTEGLKLLGRVLQWLSE